MTRRNKRYYKKLRAGWRDTVLLLKEFSWSLVLFSFVLVGGGLLFFHTSNLYGTPPVETRAEAIYNVLSLIFLQPPPGEFPSDWHLQLFYFLIPILGLGAIAQGFAEFSGLFFDRRKRSKEWEMAVASTFENHVIVIGLGHLGFQVIKNLIDLDMEVVVIELKPDADLVTEIQSYGIPVIADDANKQTALMHAGIQRAKTLMLCTQNDLLNMQIAIKGKALNPKIHVVARIFDQQFAKAIEDQFDFSALSSSVMAAPQFAATAAGLEITQPLNIEGENYSLAKLKIKSNSLLNGIKVGDLEQNYKCSLVAILGNEHSEFHPHNESIISGGETIILLSQPSEFKNLIEANERK